MVQLEFFDLQIATTAGTDIIDITPLVQEQVAAAGVGRGLVTLFTPGSTAALTTIEFEAGVINDLRRAIERLLPQELPYEHDRRWGDGNGYAHVRAAFFKPDLTVMIDNQRLVLGTWQQIVLLDFDNRPRRRIVRGQVMGVATPPT